MRRATSVFGKAECSSFPEINKCIRNSVHFIKISFVLVQNGVIVRICFFWCAVWVYLKSLNASPARDC